MSSVASGGSGAAPPTVDRIVLGQTDPNLLLASCSDAAVRVFDVRNNRQPALTLQPFRQPPVGLAFEPNCRSNMLVAASDKGEMCFIDIRMAASSSSPPGAEGGGIAVGGSAPMGGGVVRMVAAHSKGGVSALVAHHHAPLMATGTTSQVVKVWTDQGEAVSPSSLPPCLTPRSLID